VGGGGGGEPGEPRPAPPPAGARVGGAPAVTSAKGAVGHTLGAAGAIEAALTVLAIEHATVPPTANHDTPDPEIDIDVVAGAPRERDIEVAVSHSFGFGGQNAVLVFAGA
jgi:3-oxoacyl-[acyl-carrier-protein] synthase II